YRDYQRSVGAQILQLVKTQTALDAIRRLDGPAPDALSRLHGRFAGGAEQLQRLLPARHARPARGRLALCGAGHSKPAGRDLVGERGHRLGSVLRRGGGADAPRQRAARAPLVHRGAPTPVITPRTTRLMRVADLRQFRHVLSALATAAGPDGDPLAARDRLVVVPTRAAAAYLRRA